MPAHITNCLDATIREIPKVKENICCPTHGEQVAIISPMSGTKFCPLCVDEQIAKGTEQYRQELERSKRAERYGRIGIGKRHGLCRIHNFNAICDKSDYAKKWCHRYSDTLPDRVAAGDSLTILGAPGMGKTHLIAALCMGAIDHGLTSRYITAIDAIRGIKRSWAKGAGITEQEAIKELTTPDLLAIDDISGETGGERERVYLRDIINTRYAELKPTILASSESKATLDKILGAQVLRRMGEGFSKVIFLS